MGQIGSRRSGCCHFLREGTPPAFAAAEEFDHSIARSDRSAAGLAATDLNPSNLVAEYASLSSQVGDYEAAVSTLERMLIFAPSGACSLNSASSTASAATKCRAA